jgi:hypothetical protein
MRAARATRSCAPPSPGRTGATATSTTSRSSSLDENPSGEPGALEAETICGLLRTEGFPCDHRQTDVGAGASDATGDVGPHEVLVPEEALAQARALMDFTA